jgi:hypothetical protein
VGFRGKSDWSKRTFRAAVESETTQENIQDRLDLEEDDPEFQLLPEEEISAVVFFLNLFLLADLYY